jgi:hypothetical protein
MLKLLPNVVTARFEALVLHTFRQILIIAEVL